MKNLQALISHLTPGEKLLVRHFYKSRNYGECVKRGKLFDLACRQKKLNEEQTAKLLGYTSTSSSSFRNLKKRLKTDVLNVLLVQECSAKFNTPFARASFECHRNLLQGELLLARGVYNEALGLLNRASKIASDYELYAESILADDLIRNHIAQTGNLNEFTALTKGIEVNYDNLGRLHKAKQYHYEISTPSLLGVDSYEGFAAKGKAVIEKLDEMNSRHPSSRLNLYHRLAAVNYYASMHDFETAEKNALILLDAIENDSIVMSKSNCAGVNMDLAGIYLNTERYTQAVRHASNAVKLFKTGMINQLHASMILFFAYFRNNDMAGAGHTLEDVFRHPLIRDDRHPLMASRFRLLNAAFHFRNNAYEKSYSLLRRSQESVRDKDTWLPGYFLLESLNLLEKNSVDLVSYRLAAFNKMMKRNHHYQNDSRFAAIMRVLRQIVLREGDYRGFSPEKNRDIRLLADAKAEFYWNPAGYEIIRFDKWLLNKAS